MTSTETTIRKTGATKLQVTREFNASVQAVWQAWTDSSLLDQWWAPSPWKAKTKTMDFREGGHWLYAMVGPNGEESWARADFHTIDAGKSYTATDAFCDADGNIDPTAPSMKWTNRFIDLGDATRVEVEISFASEADMEKIVEMGFKEGFTAAHGNLDTLLAQGSW